MSRAWTETERQGKGRRYWFATASAAAAFEAAKCRGGYHAVRDSTRSCSVWVPFAKRLNADTVRQQAGLDPEE